MIFWFFLWFFGFFGDFLDFLVIFGIFFGFLGFFRIFGIFSDFWDFFWIFGIFSDFLDFFGGCTRIFLSEQPLAKDDRKTIGCVSDEWFSLALSLSQTKALFGENEKKFNCCRPLVTQIWKFGCHVTTLHQSHLSSVKFTNEMMDFDEIELMWRRMKKAVGNVTCSSRR